MQRSTLRREDALAGKLSNAQLSKNTERAEGSRGGGTDATATARYLNYRHRALQSGQGLPGNPLGRIAVAYRFYGGGKGFAKTRFCETNPPVKWLYMNVLERRGLEFGKMIGGEDAIVNPDGHDGAWPSTLRRGLPSLRRGGPPRPTKTFGKRRAPKTAFLPNEAICNVEEIVFMWHEENGLRGLQKNDKWLRFSGREERRGARRQSPGLETVDAAWRHAAATGVGRGRKNMRFCETNRIGF